MPLSIEKANFSRIPSSYHEVIKSKAAITSVIEISKFHKEEEYETIVVPILEKIERLVWLLNLMNGVYSSPYFESSYLIDAPPGPFSGGSGSWFIYKATGQASKKISQEDIDQISDGIQAFESKNGKEKKVFIRSLSRLAQAKGSRNIDDKVIDLCIALENMPLNDSPKEQLSLSFRMRGAWLLGKNAAQRKELYTKFKNIYRARSEIVHGGDLKKKKDLYKEISENITSYLALGEELILELLVSGFPKDWDAVVLGEN